MMIWIASGEGMGLNSYASKRINMQSVNQIFIPLASAERIEFGADNLTYCRAPVATASRNWFSAKRRRRIFSVWTGLNNFRSR